MRPGLQLHSGRVRRAPLPALPDGVLAPPREVPSHGEGGHGGGGGVRPADALRDAGRLVEERLLPLPATNAAGYKVFVASVSSNLAETKSFHANSGAFRYRNGDAITATQVFYERVNSHTSGNVYLYDQCGVRVSRRCATIQPRRTYVSVRVSGWVLG